ncbi:MAG: BlaI/MecI/CopY family transcriptional regulator [Opitutaceae bacterium]|nr:BlaI/MecI/CopY family transcriptional regulator [Opitutaceae bacterium]
MPPKISESEWEVMNTLWAKSPRTAAEVFAALPAGHGWHPKTVNTFLARLAAKGVVRISKEGNVNVYSARLRRDECVAREGRGFLERVFRGAAGPMLLHFCEQADLTAEEIRELEKLLRKKKPKK